MKRLLQVPSLLVAVFLQLAPMGRTLPAQILPAASPFAVVWQFLIGVVAVTGSFHAVSGATTLLSPKTARGKVGQAFDYKADIFSDQYGTPRSYSATGISPTPKNIGTLGFVVDNLSGIISGIPNKAGTLKIKLTGWDRSNLSGDSASYNITFTIDPGGTAPTISEQPKAQTVNVGDTVELRVSATGDSPFTFQWIRNGIELSGGRNSTLNFSPVALSDDADYSVRVTNASGNAPSATVHLTVFAPPTFTLHPSNRSAQAGTSVSFRTAATGKPTPTYQWFHENVLLVNSTNATLQVTASELTKGTHHAVASNSAGSVPCSPATLTLEPTVVPTVPPLHILSVGEINSTLEFTASPSAVYVIEYLDTLNSTLWVPAVTQSNRSGSVSAQVHNGEIGARYWRLRLGTN
ncbi:MAG: hypothetical protein EXS36_03805 [Pedosphaera sp.]|nr:hypothetical protein [Pedosphaera sp.]